MYRQLDKNASFKTKEKSSYMARFICLVLKDFGSVLRVLARDFNILQDNPDKGSWVLLQREIRPAPRERYI
jgi:hypothetical protein